MSKIITFYNHKGGVSKTTTTFNIAHLLAASGKRVLVVDADPQCNMTELMLSQLIDQLDREAEATGQQNELPGSSLLSILRPRIDGAVAFVDTDGIDMVEVRDNLYLITMSPLSIFLHFPRWFKQIVMVLKRQSYFSLSCSRFIAELLT
jgi:chromosome partitioning protein